MSNQIFVNLPVKDLKKSIAFFTQLGFTFNPQFTDDHATCMVVSEYIFVMLLVEARFQGFTPKVITDAHQQTEVLLALSFESKGKVDELMEKALASGAKETRPTQDLGFMYGRAFDDLDGHIWEMFWMNPEMIK